MRNTFFILFSLSFFSLNAQNFPKLDKSPLDIAAYPSSHRISKKDFKVIYSRPQLRGRKLKNLLPTGKVWRAGANETTEIIFGKDVIFGGQPVKKGRYSLFVIPNKKEWIIILNNAKDTWGAYHYRQAEDVVRIKTPVQIKNEYVEAFSIVFDNKQSENYVNMYLGWGNTVVSITIK